MAEIQSRDMLEAEFARKFGRVARFHMLEFRELLGDPPDIDNVPPEFWEKIKKESENWFYPLLFGVFVASAEQHGWQEAAASLAAFGWAKQRADELSSEWSAGLENKLVGGFVDIVEGKKTPETETTVEEARAAAQIRLREAPYVPTDEEIDELVERAFAPHIIARTAVDEVTRAAHAGGESAIDETVGLSLDDLWRCQETAPGQPDGKVCVICRPMNRVRREHWPAHLVDGPPCHPNDRCFVEYARVP